jgi:hypothetical protein
MTSTSGSIAARRRAPSAVIGSSIWNIRPALTFELCGMASTSQPVPASRQSTRRRSQSASGVRASSDDVGRAGTAAFRKMTFRWRFTVPGVRLHS